MEPALINQDLTNGCKNPISFYSEYISDQRLYRRWKRKSKTLGTLRKCNTDVYVKKCLDNPIIIDCDAIPHIADIQCEGDITDPQYDMFLKQVIPCGNAFALQLSKCVTGPLLLRYEDDEICGNQDVSPSPKSSNIDQINVRTEAPESLKNLPTEKEKKSFIEKNVSVEYEEPALCCLNEGKGLASCPKSVPPKLIKIPAEKITVDESYGFFMNFVSWVGDKMAYVDKDNNKVIYEKGFNAELVSSLFHSIKKDIPPKSNKDTFLPPPKQMSGSEVNIDEVECIGSQSSGRSTFREELMSVLRKSYDRKEYTELFKDISLKKKSERHRDLRGRIVRYPAGSAKSYLDLYFGVAKKIDEVQSDHRKVLNILRGFFFWLKNVAHEGSFFPWLDDSCLAILPGDNSVKNDPIVNSEV